MNKEQPSYYCECCFEPVTPVSLRTHECDPEFKARREKERDEANKELNAIIEGMMKYEENRLHEEI